MSTTPPGPLARPDVATEAGRFAALRSPQFRLLMAVGMAMQLGQWIQSVALAWVVYLVTGSAVSLATLGFLSNIFILLLSPFAGVASDRFGARRVLMFAAIVQAALGADPFCGTVYVFRSKRMDRVKLLWWDGTGICLMTKRLESGSFRWPPIEDGTMKLSAAQLSALIEGGEWSRVERPDIVRPSATQ